MEEIAMFLLRIPFYFFGLAIIDMIVGRLTGGLNGSMTGLYHGLFNFYTLAIAKFATVDLATVAIIYGTLGGIGLALLAIDLNKVIRS